MLIPVKFVVNSETSNPGLIKISILSISTPFLHLTAPNSIILSNSHESPDVSRSKKTYVESLKLMCDGFLIISKVRGATFNSIPY